MFYTIIADSKKFNLSESTIKRHKESVLYKVVFEQEKSGHIYLDDHSSIIYLDMSEASVEVIINYLRNYPVLYSDISDRTLIEKIHRDAAILGLTDFANELQDYLPVVNIPLSATIVDQSIQTFIAMFNSWNSLNNPFGSHSIETETKCNKALDILLNSEEGKRLIESITNKYTRTNKISSEISLLLLVILTICRHFLPSSASGGNIFDNDFFATKKYTNIDPNINMDSDSDNDSDVIDTDSILGGIKKPKQSDLLHASNIDVNSESTTDELFEDTESLPSQINDSSSSEEEDLNDDFDDDFDDDFNTRSLTSDSDSDSDLSVKLPKIKEKSAASLPALTISSELTSLVNALQIDKNSDIFNAISTNDDIKHIIRKFQTDTSSLDSDIDSPNSDIKPYKLTSSDKASPSVLSSQEHNIFSQIPTNNFTFASKSNYTPALSTDTELDAKPQKANNSIVYVNEYIDIP